MKKANGERLKPLGLICFVLSSQPSATPHSLLRNWPRDKALENGEGVAPMMWAESFWQEPGWIKTTILFGNQSKMGLFTINMKLKAWCTSDPEGMWVLLQELPSPVDEPCLDDHSRFPASKWTSNPMVVLPMEISPTTSKGKCQMFGWKLLRAVSY